MRNATSIFLGRVTHGLGDVRHPEEDIEVVSGEDLASPGLIQLFDET
jgi:hypothetical protein